MHRNIILSVLLVLFLFASMSARALVSEGDIAPNVSYQDIDTGEQLWLYEQYAGAIVVIECSATW